jgi:hypothetical protein
MISTFYDQVVRVEKGWVEQVFVLFIHYFIKYLTKMPMHNASI